MSDTIRTVPYDDRWPSDYELIAERLREVTPAAAELHHIGSTAIPGMAAKEVIDIQLSVSRLTDIDIRTIENVGFHHIADRADHQPPEQSLPCEELAKLFFRSDRPKAHLHVREFGRFNQRYSLLCRDFLRANSEPAASYKQIKIELAERFPADKHSYYAIKDPVFDILMAGANVWAKEVKWTLPPAD